MPSLREIAARFADGSNPATKYVGKTMYELYEFYLGALADRPITLLELGVHSGELLKTFGTYFSKGRIIGIDIKDRKVDFSAHPNVTFVLADQRDGEQLAGILSRARPRRSRRRH